MTIVSQLRRLFRPTRKSELAARAIEAAARIKAAVGEGNLARDAGRWDVAIVHYALALQLEPANAAVRVQMGHGLKELGRLAEAEAAYRAATAIRPEDADAYLQLGHALKLQGRNDEALAAYAEAVRRDPTSVPARNELIAAGGRNLLPDALYGRSASTEALSRLSGAIRSERAALADLVNLSTFPVEAYDAFRQTYPIQPPPAAPGEPSRLTVLIDAEDAHPAQIRLTLTSLLDQRVTSWTALVRADAAAMDHPVASLAEQDARIRFQALDAGRTAPPEVGPTGATLLCDAGLSFDREALGWFSLAMGRTDADAVYADHDHHTHHWRRGRQHVDPVLLWTPDLWDMLQTPSPPAALAMAARHATTALAAFRAGGKATTRRSLLVDLLERDGRAAHIPRILSSVRVPDDNGEAPPIPPRPTTGDPSGDRRPIHVILPTRDEPEVLRACVESLMRGATEPDAMVLTVVDNRSTRPETAALLETLRRDFGVRVRTFDEPFNWARINNQVALDSEPEAILVFANNDVEMLTADWDTRLREVFTDLRVGVMGARLLYPDRKVQHAGLMLGINDMRPVHEGLVAEEQAPGPNARWLRRRQVAAVTGAFMAVTRETFDRIGGFDERMAVGYNDVDFCLKARAEGLGVLFEPEMALLHHESRTRGRNDDGAKTFWDDEELTELHHRWRGWMMFDPGKNPQWLSTHERPFDGFRDLGASAVLAHIDLSARPRPWSIDRSFDPLSDHGA